MPHQLLDSRSRVLPKNLKHVTLALAKVRRNSKGLEVTVENLKGLGETDEAKGPKGDCQ